MGMSPNMALGMQAAGATAGAFGAYRSAQAQRATLGYEAAVAQNNETIANYQAAVAEQNGAAAEQAQELKTAALRGDQRAALAANGVDLGTGSAAETLATTDFMGARDALTIRDNTARQAWALRQQGKGYAAEAATDRSTARAINPLMAGASSLLTSGSSVASSWYKYNRSVNGTGGST